MMKKYMALFLAMFLMTASTVFANSGTEYVTMAEEYYLEAFNDYDSQERAEDKDGIRKFVYTASELTPKATYNLDSTVSDNEVEISFKVLPVMSGGKKTIFFLQFLQGNDVALEMRLEANASTSKYRLTDGKARVVLADRDDLYQLESANDAFTAEDFNDIKIVMNRTEQRLYAYVNGVETTEAGGIDISESQGLNAIKYASHNIDISKVNFYFYTSSGYDPDQFMYFDEVKINGTKQVFYDPSALSLDCAFSMDYSGETAVLNVTNGTDSMYLGQEMVLNLVSVADETQATEIAVVSVQKETDETASFSFSEPVGVTPGWYYAEVARKIGGEVKGNAKRQKLYVASTEQLSALPGDFSNLPENDSEACAKVESYLPCFLTEEEINALLPVDNTVLADANLNFITAYFKNCDETFATVTEVQASFTKAKGYLALKNAVNQAEVESVLTQGGYLAEYVQNEIYTEKKAEFYALFEAKRNDSQNPLLSDEAILSALRFSIALTTLNQAERSEIQGIVETYNDVLQLDLSKVTVQNADTLYAQMYHKNYTALMVLQADWLAAVNSLATTFPETPKEETEKDYPTGGGFVGGGVVVSPSYGGGGGGGGGVAIKLPEPQEAPQLAPVEVKTSALFDVEKHWAEAEIKVLLEKGIVNGYEDGTFRPEETLSRAELVTMLARALPEVKTENTAVFTDVSQNDWFYASVSKLSALGIVQGTDGRFLPNDSITREQLAVMVYRALKGSATEAALSFADEASISDYAKEAIGYLVEKGILSGFEDNTVRPQEITSRAQAAKVLSKLLSEFSIN